MRLPCAIQCIAAHRLAAAAAAHSHALHVVLLRTDAWPALPPFTCSHPEVAERFSVHNLPTLILFKDGRVVDRLEGLLPSPDFQVRQPAGDGRGAL